MSSVEGLDELLATLSGLGGDIKQACYKGIIRGAKTIQKNAKYLAPSKNGHLRNSIKIKGEIKQDSVEGQVFVGAKYGVYVEFGTGQKGLKQDVNGKTINHTAKDKWVYTPDGGNTFYTTTGQPAQPYMTPAYLHAKNTDEVEQQVARAIQQEIRKLERGK